MTSPSSSAKEGDGNTKSSNSKMDAAELAAAKVDECHFFYEDEVSE